MGPKTAERTEFVVSVLKEAKGELVPGRALREALKMNTSNFYTFMQQLKKIYPSKLRSVQGGRHHESGYFWVTKEKEPAKEEVSTTEPAKKEVRNRFDDRRTEEGYSDPTAYLAMRTVENGIHRGEIWEVGGSNGKISYQFVLASNGPVATCIQVYRDPSAIYDNEKNAVDNAVIGGEKLYFNPMKLSTKPTKYFLALIESVSEEEYKPIINAITACLKLYQTVNVVAVSEPDYSGYIKMSEHLKEVEEARASEREQLEKEFAKRSASESASIDLSDYISIEKHIEAVKAAERVAKETYEMALKEQEDMLREEIEKELEMALIKQRAEIYQDAFEKLLKRGM